MTLTCTFFNLHLAISVIALVEVVPVINDEAYDTHAQEQIEGPQMMTPASVSSSPLVATQQSHSLSPKYFRVFISATAAVIVFNAPLPQNIYSYRLYMASQIVEGR